MAPRIVLHHLKFSRGTRIFWVLEELGLPYDVVVHQMTPGTAYATSLAAVTPLSKSPAILLDGRLIYESGAIITELLAQFPHAGVEGTPSQQSTFWSYFSEGGVMLFFQPARFLTTGASLIKKGLSAEEQKGSEALLKWMNGWSNNHINMALGQVEKYLADHEWFSGTDQIGLGDFMMITPIMAVRSIKLPVGPNTHAWLKRVRARPGWQRALARMKQEEKAFDNKGKL